MDINIAEVGDVMMSFSALINKGQNQQTPELVLRGLLVFRSLFREPAIAALWIA